MSIDSKTKPLLASLGLDIKRSIVVVLNITPLLTLVNFLTVKNQDVKLLTVKN